MGNLHLSTGRGQSTRQGIYVWPESSAPNSCQLLDKRGTAYLSRTDHADYRLMISLKELRGTRITID